MELIKGKNIMAALVCHYLDMNYVVGTALSKILGNTEFNLLNIFQIICKYSIKPSLLVVFFVSVFVGLVIFANVVQHLPYHLFLAV